MDYTRCERRLTSASSGRRERYPDVSAGAPLMRNTLGAFPF